MVAPDRKPVHWPIALAVLAMTYLVAIVFFPILGFEFVDYDVDEQVVHNPHIHGLTGENLKHIFTSRCINSYYPVRTLSHAVDYSVWGPNPRGFKLTNVLLHLSNVMLVFWLILRLYSETPSREGSPRLWDVFAAAFAAGIFAIHPVVVEPVAWVAGREELLMTLGALGCFHCHLSARGLGEDASWTAVLAWYGAAAISCALACLSNAVAAVIPFLITAWDLLTLAKSMRRQLFFGTGTLWLVCAATITIKVLGNDPESTVLEAGTSVAERMMLVLSVYWLNVKSLLWPTDLAIYYSRSTAASFLHPSVILGGIILGATCLSLWKLRRQTVCLFGLLWFGLALGPSSQIMVHHIHRADRFLYLPLVGLAVTVAFAVRQLGPMLKTRAAVVGTVSVAVLVIWLLDVRSTRQVLTWQDSVSMWENCVKVSPDNAVAHDLLARNLAKLGDIPRAEEHALRSLELDLAGNPAALCTRAVKAVRSGELGQAGREEAVRFAERACELTEWNDPKSLRTLAMTYFVTDRHNEGVATAEKAATVAEKAGDMRLADDIRNWLRGLERRPEGPGD